MPLAIWEQQHILKFSQKNTWKSSKELGNDLGITPDAVSNFRERHIINGYSKYDEYIKYPRTKICKGCNKEFIVNNSKENHKIYCNQECKITNKQNTKSKVFVKKICKECGKEFETYKLYQDDFCSKYCVHINKINDKSKVVRIIQCSSKDNWKSCVELSKELNVNYLYVVSIRRRWKIEYKDVFGHVYTPSKINDENKKIILSYSTINNWKTNSELSKLLNINENIIWYTRHKNNCTHKDVFGE